MCVAGDELSWFRATGTAIDNVISYSTPVVVFRTLFFFGGGNIGHYAIGSVNESTSNPRTLSCGVSVLRQVTVRNDVFFIFILMNMSNVPVRQVMTRGRPGYAQPTKNHSVVSIVILSERNKWRTSRPLRACCISSESSRRRAASCQSFNRVFTAPFN